MTAEKFVNLTEEIFEEALQEHLNQQEEAEKSASKRFTLTADDLVEPSNMWHVKAIQRYNKTGFCNNLLGEIEDYPQAVVKGLIEQTRTIL